MSFGNRLRKYGRPFVYALTRLLGANYVMRHRNRKLIRIFVLHGVADYESEHCWVPLRDQFPLVKLVRLLEALVNEYNFVSLDHAVRIIKGIDPPMDNCAVLTFDDGYKNNFDVALPALRELSIPATFYVTTGFVESRKPFWFDRLDYVIQQAARYSPKFSIGDRRFEFADGDRVRLKEVYAELRDYCKTTYNCEDEFLRVLAKLAEDLEKLSSASLVDVLETDEWACIVSKAQLARVNKDELVTIGSHTVKHLRLKFADLEEVRYELRESSADLTRWTGDVVCHFAYPNGAYDEVTVKEVESAGYHSAVTSDSGMNAVGDSPFTLARLSLSPDLSLSEMLGRASGLEDVFTRLVRVAC